MLSSKYKDLKFYSDDDTKKIADELEKAITVPVNIEVEAEHRVYDFSEMKEILESADRLGVQTVDVRRHSTTATPQGRSVSALAGWLMRC